MEALRPPKPAPPEDIVSYADKLLVGIMDAIELEIWEVAEAITKVLARHIEETGEYPTAVPRVELERIMASQARAVAYGPA
jgi:hypothetical protein